MAEMYLFGWQQVALCIFLPPLAVSDTAMGIVITPLVGMMDQQVSPASVF